MFFKMFLVGLTGGISSGKSTVSSMLRELGCPIIDADVVARKGRWRYVYLQTIQMYRVYMNSVKKLSSSWNLLQDTVPQINCVSYITDQNILGIITFMIILEWTLRGWARRRFIKTNAWRECMNDDCWLQGWCGEDEKVTEKGEKCTATWKY